MFSVGLLSFAVAGLLQATSVLAQEPPSCSLSQKCPEEAPCCSQLGRCGVAAYCLGGCDPRMSFSKESCVPAPVCKSRKMKMDSMDRLMSMDKYLGDPDSADWVYSGEPTQHGSNILMTMAPRTPGTVLSSTVYMWYGSVRARMKTSRGKGVITAFILYSDVKDEIDFEWVGVDLETAQTNYYFQGIPLYDQAKNLSASSTNDVFHDYEIQWTPDEIKWLVDGKERRKKLRSDTWNETSNQWHFPQTPSRVQLSVWPGGADGNAQGTIDWAGGRIDWDSDDIKKNKYYYATISEIEIKCFDADKPPGTNKGKSYWYNDLRGTNDTVVDGDRKTVLKSLGGTGLDMDKDEDGSDGVSRVPGTGTAGTGQNPGGSAGVSGAGGDDCSSGFSQNCSGKGPKKNAAGRTRTGSSGLAVVVAAAAAVFL